MHRYAKRAHSPNVHCDCYDKSTIFVDHRENAISQARMLQNLARLNRSIPASVLPVFVSSKIHEASLCGVIFNNDGILTWYDFDVKKCRLVSGRNLESHDVVTLRNEIHRAGIHALPNGSKVTIRNAKQRRYGICKEV